MAFCWESVYLILRLKWPRVLNLLFKLVLPNGTSSAQSGVNGNGWKSFTIAKKIFCRKVQVIFHSG